MNKRAVMDDFKLNGNILIRYIGEKTNITLPTGITRIADDAFRDCKKIESVVVPEGVISIGSRAFLSCSKLKRVMLPSSLVSIGFSAFNGCKALENINIPDNVSGIGGNAFYKCCSLYVMKVPGKVQTIKGKTFYGCTKLSAVTFGEGVRKINMEAFSGCVSLRVVKLPASITQIHEAAFYRKDLITFIKDTGTFVKEPLLNDAVPPKNNDSGKHCSDNTPPKASLLKGTIIDVKDDVLVVNIDNNRQCHILISELNRFGFNRNYTENAFNMDEEDLLI